ncbi:MAG TPA: peptide chain release factor N(5)-glutamine methyltransferase [Candidatus Krumholzibacteria bacterium]|jgi:release factor glutamine methyltransferase|nr:peptide chain release factor N(5)-glutamine methyltransferase [Candidatus Krumholzibacteria bacterium]
MSVQTWKILDLLRSTAHYFETRGAGAPRLAAERLLAHVLSCKRVDLYLAGERVLNDAELDGYRGLVRAHARGEPLQYLVGETEFMGLPLRTDRRALIPRPETEILVEAVRQRFAKRLAPPRFLELGTGCGAIAVSLAAALPRAEVWCTELRAETAALARENCRRHGVEARVQVVVTDAFAALAPELEASFDALVSNPPYVRSDELAGLPALVRDHEPLVALDGGEDGVFFHRFLCNEGVRFLAPGGTLAVEIGADQGAAVRGLFVAAGFQDVTVLRDYAGHERVVLGLR